MDNNGGHYLKCKKCHYDNESHAKFCSSCGANLQEVNMPKWLWPILFMIFLALGGVIFGLWKVYELTEEQKPINSEPVKNNYLNTVKMNEIDRVTLIKNVQQKVFTILTSYSRGSGFLYAKGGYVVTNAHVVDGEVDVIVRNSKGQEFDATVIGISEHYDIALLHVPTYENEDPLPIETNESPVGLEVIAFGSPNGFENSASIGYITGTNRDMELDRFIYKQIYQVDVQIDHGSSGGPLVDSNTGKVVGINSLLYTSKSNTNFGFAIPIYSMIDYFEQWIQQPMSRQDILAVAGIYEDYYDEDSYENELPLEDDNTILAGQFVQSFRMYYELALNESNFYWIADMVTGTAYEELEDYISDIAYKGHQFIFLTNDILDVTSHEGYYLVETNETFDFYSASGDYQYFDRYKTYTVIVDEYGNFKISDITIHK